MEGQLEEVVELDYDIKP